MQENQVVSVDDDGVGIADLRGQLTASFPCHTRNVQDPQLCQPASDFATIYREHLHGISTRELSSRADDADRQ